jgi:N utilization substance protein A
MPGMTPSLVQKLNAAGISTVEQLADLAPEDLENIPGIGAKTIEKISDVLSDYYTQSTSYQDEMERLAQQHMFSKDEPVVEKREEEVEKQEASPSEDVEGKESREESVPEE